MDENLKLKERCLVSSVNFLEAFQGANADVHVTQNVLFRDADSSWFASLLGYLKTCSLPWYFELPLYF